MSDLYSIKAETLTDIGNALRRKHGETREEFQYENYVVVKTDGATGFDNLNTSPLPNNLDIRARLQFDSKVTRIVVKFACYYEAGIVFAINGEMLSYNTDETIITEQTVNDDYVSIAYYRASSHSGQVVNGSLYAEVRGYDSDDNLVPYSVTPINVPNTYTSSEMAAAIDAIEVGTVLPEEALVITGNCRYKFAFDGWNWFIDAYGNRVTSKDITYLSNMFDYSRITNIPFDLNCIETQAVSVSRVFGDCDKLISLPRINNLLADDMSGMFNACKMIREIPSDYCDSWNWNKHMTSTSSYQGNKSGLIQSCYSLRRFPMTLFEKANPISSTNYTYFYNGFYGCFALDELINLPIPYTATYTSNLFYSSFVNCNRLKTITFAMPDGQPYVMNWKSQVIDLTSYVGYAQYPTNITSYNSGLTSDTRVINDETYQALKDNPDWFTTQIEYSRYNHDSAVATINSLPDTSAYLATAGGTNTIKFKGNSGSATDGGAINTLTEEEIAVATAKGWTVTFA